MISASHRKQDYGCIEVGCVNGVSSGAKNLSGLKSMSESPFTAAKLGLNSYIYFLRLKEILNDRNTIRTKSWTNLSFLLATQGKVNIIKTNAKASNDFKV